MKLIFSVLLNLFHLFFNFCILVFLVSSVLSSVIVTLNTNQNQIYLRNIQEKKAVDFWHLL